MSRSYDIHQLRKRYAEQSGEPAVHDVAVYRSKGHWCIDDPNTEFGAMLIRNGVVEIPDLDYVEWLEDKLIELLNQ